MTQIDYSRTNIMIIYMTMYTLFLNWRTDANSTTYACDNSSAKSLTARVPLTHTLITTENPDSS